jgi:predicted  nucleic acid-binding Zn ribbon protein
LSLRDPYHLLGPFDYTSEEMCGCGAITALILRDTLTPNPLACGTCFGEVPPEDIPLDPGIVASIFQWRTVYQALYNLWLDSGDYESWAATQLEDVAGQVNVVGRGLAGRLSTPERPCYYWWFVRDSSLPPEYCPICEDGPMAVWPHRSARHCPNCRLMVS